MVDAGIGRLLVASLHQGIADVAPARLVFYENWLTPAGLRDGKFSLAPLHAVLSFLRLEGQPTYDGVMRRAGEYTADWWYDELPTIQRSALRRLPPQLRARIALFLSRHLVRSTFRGTWMRTRLRNGEGRVEIRGSVFCNVREINRWPTCVFYASALARLLQRFDVAASTSVRDCRASGGNGCSVDVRVRGELDMAAAEAA